jgi:hypothetical protein
MLLISRNLCTTPEPKVYPAPLGVCFSSGRGVCNEKSKRMANRGEIAKSSFSGSGSDLCIVVVVRGLGKREEGVLSTRRDPPWGRHEGPLYGD